MKRLIKANELGELIYEYKNGMKEYVVKNVNVPKSENNMFLAMDSVIKHDFIEFFNSNYYEIKRSNYDYNVDNGIFTVYTNEDPSLNNLLEIAISLELLNVYITSFIVFKLFWSSEVIILSKNEISA